MSENKQGGAFGGYWRGLKTAERAQQLRYMWPSASAVKFIASGRRGSPVETATRLEAAMQHVEGVKPLQRFDMRPECASGPHRACGATLVPAQGSTRSAA